MKSSPSYISPFPLPAALKHLVMIHLKCYSIQFCIHLETKAPINKYNK